MNRESGSAPTSFPADLPASGHLVAAVFVAAVLASAALVGAGCKGDGGPVVSDAVSPDATTPDATMPDVLADVGADIELPAPPDPTAPGPWGVGVAHVDWTDESRGRSLPVEIWYPTAADATDGQETAFELELAGAVLGSIASRARRDAAPANGGLWPLVLFSHGNQGARFQSLFYCEHLASHGFIVASPDHVGNTISDPSATREQAAIDRPLDMILVLDKLLADDTWSIDPDLVGITGHSFGGWTSLEAARRDARFRVVVPLAPGFLAGTEPGDAASVLDRPLFVIGGAADGITPFETDSRPVYDAAGPPRYLARIARAGHFGFTDVCDAGPVSGMFPDGCEVEAFDPAATHHWVNALATPFFLTHLLGRDGYAERLSPDRYTAEDGIDLWADILDR